MGPNFQERCPNSSTKRKSKFHGVSMSFIFDQKIRYCHTDGHEVLTICYVYTFFITHPVEKGLLLSKFSSLLGTNDQLGVNRF